jgi:hypothetical protein
VENLVDNAHGVRLSLCRACIASTNGIVMPTRPGCLFNQIEVLPTGDSGRVGGCGCHRLHVSFFAIVHIVGTICAFQSRVEQREVRYIYVDVIRISLTTLVDVVSSAVPCSHAAKLKFPTTSARSCGFELPR